MLLVFKVTEWNRDGFVSSQKVASTIDIVRHKVSKINSDQMDFNNPLNATDTNTHASTHPPTQTFIYLQISHYICMNKMRLIVGHISFSTFSEMTNFCYPDKSWFNRINRKLGTSFRWLEFRVHLVKRKVSNE